LWIRIVSSQFKNLGIQSRTHKLTQILELNSPKIFQTYLFGFEAYTPEEWYKIKGGGSSGSPLTDEEQAPWVTVFDLGDGIAARE
jgi:hypothetical protein